MQTQASAEACLVTIDVATHRLLKGAELTLDLPIRLRVVAAGHRQTETTLARKVLEMLACEATSGRAQCTALASSASY